MSEDSQPIPDRLHRALAAFRMPDAVVTAWRGDLPAQARGQVWRARWGDVTEIIVVLDVQDMDWLVAAPATVEVEFVDDTVVVLPVEVSPLGGPLAVWVDLSRPVPVRVLDRYIGTVGDPASLTAPGAMVPTIASSLDRRLEMRAGLEDSMDSLAAASRGTASTGTLPSMLASNGIGLKELQALVGAPVSWALAVLRGGVPVNSEEAGRLAPTLGCLPEDVLAANPAPPVDLATLMDRPPNRGRIRQLAQRQGISEDQAWAKAVQGVWALAARQTGAAASDPAWAGRIDRYFAAVLG